MRWVPLGSLLRHVDGADLGMTQGTGALPRVCHSCCNTKHSLGLHLSKVCLKHPGSLVSTSLATALGQNSKAGNVWSLATQGCLGTVQESPGGLGAAGRDARQVCRAGGLDKCAEQGLGQGCGVRVQGRGARQVCREGAGKVHMAGVQGRGAGQSSCLGCRAGV